MILFSNKNKVMKQRNYILPVCFLLCCVLPSIGQQHIVFNDSDTLKLDPSVRYGKLENGFTYYLRHNDEPKNEVYFEMVVKAGYFHENNQQQEYAHLLEHMGYKGTNHFPELAKYIHNLGGDTHAGTADIYTNYWAKSSRKNQEILNNSMKILEGWAQGIKLDPASIDVERGAILGEARTDNPYWEWYHETARKMVEQGSGHRKKDKETRIANIRNFNKDAFNQFYKDWYRPDLEAAIIIGDINIDSLEMEIKRLFTKLQMPENPKKSNLEVLGYNIKLDGQNRYKVYLDTIRQEPLLRIFSKSTNPGYNPKTRADFRNLLIQKVYEEILLARMSLMKQYSPLFTLSPIHDYADQQLYTLLISINFHEDSLLKMKQKFLKSMMAFRSINSDFTEKELKDAKEIVLKKMFLTNKFRNTNELAKKYRNHFVLGTAALAPEDEEQMVNELLAQIYLNDVEEAAIHYSDLTENIDFLYQSGSDTENLDFITIQNWLKELYNLDVEPFSPKVAVTSLKDVVKVSENNNKAVKTITKNQIGVTTVELSNGIKLVLKPTENSNYIEMRASRPNNVPIRNKKEYMTALIAPNAIQFAGGGPYTKFQIEEFSGGVDVQLNQKLERTEQLIIGKSRSDRFEHLLQLLWLYTQKPRMDEEAFKEWKIREQRTIKQGNPDRNMFFDSAIEKLRFPELPMPNSKYFDSLSMDEVYAAYHRWYSNFGEYTFVFTGGFEADTLLPILVKYLSVLPKGNVRAPKEHEMAIIPLKKISEVKHIKNISQAYIFLHFPVVSNTDTKTKVLVNLLGNAFQSRIWDRLRKGSYTPTVKVHLMDFKHGIYNFQISFDAETGKEETLIRWAMEELRELKQNGVDKEWFEKNLDLRISKYKHRFNSSRFWNDYLSEKVKNGESITAEFLEYEAILRHFITLEDFNKAAKELLSDRYLQKFVFLPMEYTPTSEVKVNKVKDH